MRRTRSRANIVPHASALQRLYDDGARLALVTSNGTDNCRRILGEDVMARFAHVECGASILGQKQGSEHHFDEMVL
ncbi:hypothetical protein LK996_10005 [Lysobacter sp. A6]|uniref:Uncharacterized protein n=1 Tax=Noviluteimonas lactosilytica TaxID=2888523 RepID=A0ABS8JIR5_9GAMM|nr:hypothetical protein [Lysobacter lactosilyticus]MCC8363405.1 hypothetical protein [Lysobacter lactosilyticus]